MSTQWPCTFLFILKRSVNLIRDNQVGMYFIVENISKHYTNVKLYLSVKKCLRDNYNNFDVKSIIRGQRQN